MSSKKEENQEKRRKQTGPENHRRTRQREKRIDYNHVLSSFIPLSSLHTSATIRPSVVPLDYQIPKESASHFNSFINVTFGLIYINLTTGLPLETSIATRWRTIPSFKTPSRTKSKHRSVQLHPQKEGKALHIDVTNYPRLTNFGHGPVRQQVCSSWFYS